ncbi:MAG: DNA starvation/stationary phase protection protein [Saprospiraceae bacterium]|nr:DNA starvation/stationary phase protection protein [Saprospiraceae bacterium]MCB9324400.1 DNA starvation/stationary phase protection protein [Lewinellaceae bacterium]
MMQNTIGINQVAANKLVTQLNDLLANYEVYYQNLRAFHWNITGPGFFELHLKFEALYTAANTSIDEIAERILTLEGQPLHTFTDFLSASTIKEAKGLTTAGATVQTVIENLGTLIAIERDLLKNAAEADDEGTVSMISDYIKAQEKEVWMLRSYVG